MSLPRTSVLGLALSLGCVSPSKQIGATSSAAAEGGSAGTTAADGTGDTTERGDDAGASTGDDACFAMWAEPIAEVTAPGRPDAAVPGMRLGFTYVVGRITLAQIDEEPIVQPSDGPFSVDTHSGAWAELRDAADATLYTRGVFELVPETVEVQGPLGQLPSCPEQGSLQLANFPNLADATTVVLFQGAIDGDPSGPTIELVRFALP